MQFLCFVTPRAQPFQYIQVVIGTCQPVLRHMLCLFAMGIARIITPHSIAASNADMLLCHAYALKFWAALLSDRSCTECSASPFSVMIKPRFWPVYQSLHCVPDGVAGQNANAYGKLSTQSERQHCFLISLLLSRRRHGTYVRAYSVQAATAPHLSSCE